MLDLKNLSQIAEGDQILIDKLLATFFQTTRDDLKTLAKAVESKNMPGVSGTSHRIKGGAAIVGASGLASIAGKLEQLGKTGSIESCHLLLTELQIQFSTIEKSYPGF